MHILVLEGDHVEAEFREKFGAAHDYQFIKIHNYTSEEYYSLIENINNAALKADVAFCFSDPTHYSNIYQMLPPVDYPVFVEMLSDSLSDIHRENQLGPRKGTFINFCGLPTLINRSLLEVSLYHEADREQLAETCAALGTDYRVVADRVGLVTPRVICQIINEACFTVQEGTATMQDVDLGMKLGTNYPRGPFAWANAIGVERVYAVLEALWHDTHDERYKICPLLKRQALRGEPFDLLSS